MADIVVSAAIETRQAQAGARQFNAALASMRGGILSTNSSMGAMGAAMRLLPFAVVAVAAGGLSKAVIDAGDSFSQLKARIGLVTAEGESVTGVLEGLNQAAARARAPVGELTQLFQRNATALQAMGLSTADGIRLAETLHKVTVVSGTGAQQAAAGMMQLSQAIQSGRFQGDEFRSVAENIPELMRILQRETGKTAGELRKLAGEGKLTADVLVNALSNAASDVDAKFAKMPETVESAWKRLTDVFSQQIGKAAEAEGATRGWIDALNEVTKWAQSDGGMSVFKSLADAVGQLGDGFAYSARQARVMAIETELSGRAAEVAESQFWKFWESIKKTAGDLAGLAMWAGRSAITGTSDPEIRKQAEALADMKGTFTPESDAIVAASAPLTGDAKKPITFGSGTDEAAAKKTEKLRADLAKAYDIQQQRNIITEVEIAGNGALAEKLRVQLEIRERISDEMRRTDPEKAARLEQEIALQSQLSIQLDNQREMQERNTQFAREFSSTITQGFSAAITSGQGLSDTLRDVGLKLVDVVMQATLLKPLENNLTNLIGGGLNGSSGFDIGSLFSGGATTGGWTPTVTAFANGGVLSSPASFSSGGMRGVAGEAGPEAILPLKRGADGSLGVRMAGAGGGQQAGPTITINIAGDATDSTVAKLRGEMQAIVAQLSPGIVRQSVAEVRRENMRDRNYLRR